MNDELFTTSIPGNLKEGEQVQTFTLPARPVKHHNSPAAVLQYKLFLAAVKDAREFQSAMMKYKALRWTKAQAAARQSRNHFLRIARRYLDRSIEFEELDSPTGRLPSRPNPGSIAPRTADVDRLVQAYRSAYPSAQGHGKRHDQN